MPADLTPDALRLLEAPNLGCLGTIRPDDTVQVNPMWFLYDGEHVLFTHTTKRAKYRNLQANPSMSLAVFDPENGYHYVELRGRLLEARPDPTGAFFVTLAERYGSSMGTPEDAADRVVLVMSVEHHTAQ